jgi:hypothetical protein
METLKLVQESKGVNIPVKRSKNRSVKKDDDIIDLFPLPRYFQLHFEHAHQNIHDLQSELVQLKEYVAKVDEKLECLVALLIRSPEQSL